MQARKQSSILTVSARVEGIYERTWAPRSHLIVRERPSRAIGGVSSVTGGARWDCHAESYSVFGRND
jgi:hypothetical protein